MAGRSRTEKARRNVKDRRNYRIREKLNKKRSKGRIRMNR